MFIGKGRLFTQLSATYDTGKKLTNQNRKIGWLLNQNQNQTIFNNGMVSIPALNTYAVKYRYNYHSQKLFM